MKRSKKIILILQIISILFSVLYIFLGKKTNEYIISSFLTIIFIISWKLLGFEKEKIINSRKILKTTIFLTISYIILTYGIGLFLGYVRTPYSLRLNILLRNVLPILLIILPGELLRYQFCKKGSNSITILILTVCLFTLVDILINIDLYNLNEKAKVLELICNVILPSICKNIVLTNFANCYGYSMQLAYTIIINLYIYLVPIFPNLDIYLDSVIKILLPIIILLTTNYLFKKTEKKDIRDNRILSKIIIVLLIIIIVLMISLNSNLFRYWAATIGSGSMTPTIEVGDVVIVDKIYQKKLEKLRNGDILVFKYKNKIYTHRIINIEKHNSEYFIKTKGDRKENEIDAWTVRNGDVVGVVKYRIKYLGYPTVWLNKLIKGVN